MNAFYSNATGTYNVANGYEALYFNTSGYSNVANGSLALYSNTTGYNNTANGVNALYSNTTGAYNVANGLDALYSNTTGYNNTATGLQALYSNATGTNNTANGLYALYSNTGGGDNTANGVEALVDNTIGYNNTANGVNALKLNTTGYENTANGVNALTYNVTGSDNTATGLQALYSNTTGYNNTANGVNALKLNTTGSDNTANGLDALYSNTTGYNNTAEAPYALYYNASATNTVAIGLSAAQGTSAYNNQGITAIGYQSGYNFQTGSDYNTLLGYQSGYDITTGHNNLILGDYTTTGTGITTGSGNILIGNGVTAGLSQTGSGQLNIGNLIYGTSLGTGSTVSSGNVGIGTTSPYQALSVNGNLAFTGSPSILADNNITIKSNNNQSVTVNGRNLFFQGLQGGSAGYIDMIAGGIPVESFYTAQSNEAFRIDGLNAQVGTIDAQNLQLMASTTVGAVLTTTGNFGIGTTSPASTLSVAGNTLLDSNIINFASSSASALTFNYLAKATSTILANALGAFSIATSSASGVTPIFSISTSNTINAASTTSTVTATSSFQGGFDVNNGALRYDYGSGVTSIENLALGNMRFESDAGAVSWTDMPVTSLSPSGTIESYTAQLNANPILTIFGKADGSGGVTNLGVGIGTTSPYSMLSVAGQVVGQNFVATSTAATSTFAGGLNVGSGGLLYDLSTQNVGIGNNSPLYKLDIGGSSGISNYLRLTNSSSGVGLNSGFQIGMSGANAVLYNGQNGQMQFSTNGTQYMTLTGTGNLGIGTTSPRTLLEVGGGGRTNFLSFGSYPGLYVDPSGSNNAQITLNNAGNVEGGLVSHTNGIFYMGSFRNNDVQLIANNQTALTLQAATRRTGGTHVYDLGMSLSLIERGYYLLSCDALRYGNAVLPVEAVLAKSAGLLLKGDERDEGVIISMASDSDPVLGCIAVAKSVARVRALADKFSALWYD